MEGDLQQRPTLKGRCTYTSLHKECRHITAGVWWLTWDLRSSMLLCLGYLLLVSKQLIQPGSEKNCLFCFHVTCTQGWLAGADYALTVYSHAKRQTHWWWKIAIDDGKAHSDLMELFRNLSRWTNLLHRTILQVATLIVHLRHLSRLHIRAPSVGNLPSVCSRRRENHLS